LIVSSIAFVKFEVEKTIFPKPALVTVVARPTERRPAGGRVGTGIDAPPAGSAVPTR